MKLWKQYIFLETKRMIKGLPAICLGSLFLIALLAGIFTLFQLNSSRTKEGNPVEIGVVAKKDEPFVDWMITTISNIENTKYTCRFQRLDEKNADTSLKSGKTDIIFLIPEDYIASIIKGENKHLTIRFGSSQSTIVSFLFRELSHAASAFILDTEAGIYSMQEYYEQHSLPNQADDEFELNLQYIKEIVSLDKGIETEKITTETEKPLLQQYLISALVLLLFFWGLTCSRMLTPQSKAFQDKLAQKGIGTAGQIFARGLAFFITAFINYLFLFVLASIFMGVTSLNIPGTLCATICGLWKFAFLCIPILLLSTSFIQLAYEITEDAMGGILFLFFSILAMGLCSGCFYPRSYLPQALQTASSRLPVWQACRYGLYALDGTFHNASFFYLAACSALCYFLMALRRYRPQTFSPLLEPLNRHGGLQ